ncbi:hypothetical protein IMZ48_14855 [Candidatus Bathyarchaeota archaeon]|nr:hypothetical protein [Candidatus Bathyarchaeota archaeon]
MTWNCIQAPAPFLSFPELAIPGNVRHLPPLPANHDRPNPPHPNLDNLHPTQTTTIDTRDGRIRDKMGYKTYSLLGLTLSFGTVLGLCTPLPPRAMERTAVRRWS